MNSRQRIALGLIMVVTGLVTGLFFGPAHALDPPAGKVVLQITGNISHTNGASRAEFDMAMLEKLPQHSFATRTPWHDHTPKFTGPLLSDVLAAVGAQGSKIRAVALNDYAVEIPIEDTRKFKVLLARLMDDKPMAVRDKGPLFIIYPFDSSKELGTSQYYARSIWQLKALDIQ